MILQLCMGSRSGFNFLCCPLFIVGCFLSVFMMEQCMQVPYVNPHCMITVIISASFLCINCARKKKVLVLVGNRPSCKCPLSSCVRAYKDLLMFHIVIILFLVKINICFFGVVNLSHLSNSSMLHWCVSSQKKTIQAKTYLPLWHCVCQLEVYLGP